MGEDPQEAVSALYRRLLDGWNARDTPAAYHGRPELGRALTEELAPLVAPRGGRRVVNP